MARTLIAAAVLAMALVGCGYEPATDRPSDPLSPADREAVEEALDSIDLLCDEAGSLAGELMSEDVETLTQVAKKRPHGVYRPSGELSLADQSSFSGDTMIQVLERAAHEYDDCSQRASRDMRRSADLLRSPR